MHNKNDFFSTNFKKFFGLGCDIERQVSNEEAEMMYINSEPENCKCGPLDELDFWKRRYSALCSAIEKVL